MSNPSEPNQQPDVEAHTQMISPPPLAGRRRRMLLAIGCALAASGAAASAADAAVFSPAIRPDVYQFAVSDCDITVGPVYDDKHPGLDAYHKIGGARVNCRTSMSTIRAYVEQEWRYVGDSAPRAVVGTGYGEMYTTKGWDSRITMTTAACGRSLEWRSSATVQVNNGAWVTRYSRWASDLGTGAACPSTH